MLGDILYDVVMLTLVPSPPLPEPTRTQLSRFKHIYNAHMNHIYTHAHTHAYYIHTHAFLRVT